MKSLTINATLREADGKKAAKTVRETGEVLCVLYGGEQVINFKAPVLTFRELVYTHEAFIVELNIDGNKYKAVMQDIQFHPISDKILHIDFLQLFDNKAVTMKIPVQVTGNSVGVRQGGKLITKVRFLRVRSLPNKLPDAITVNVDTLDIGKAIRVSDIKLEGVEILDSPTNVITTVKLTRQAIAAAATTATEAKKK
jgi:large subunit ribosomal protein L25